MSEYEEMYGPTLKIPEKYRCIDRRSGKVRCRNSKEAKVCDATFDNQGRPELEKALRCVIENPNKKGMPLLEDMYRKDYPDFYANEEFGIFGQKPDVERDSGAARYASDNFYFYTIDQLRDEIRNKGYKPTGSRKRELIDQLRKLGGPGGVPGTAPKSNSQRGYGTYQLQPMSSYGQQPENVQTTTNARSGLTSRGTKYGVMVGGVRYPYGDKGAESIREAARQPLNYKPLESIDSPRGQRGQAFKNTTARVATKDMETQYELNPSRQPPPRPPRPSKQSIGTQTQNRLFADDTPLVPYKSNIRRQSASARVPTIQQSPSPARSSMKHQSPSPVRPSRSRVRKAFPPSHISPTPSHISPTPSHISPTRSSESNVERVSVNIDGENFACRKAPSASSRAVVFETQKKFDDISIFMDRKGNEGLESDDDSDDADDADEDGFVI